MQLQNVEARNAKKKPAKKRKKLKREKKLKTLKPLNVKVNFTWDTSEVEPGAYDLSATTNN